MIRSTQPNNNSTVPHLDNMKSTCLFFGVHVFWIVKLCVFAPLAAMDTPLTAIDEGTDLPVCSQALDLDQSDRTVQDSSCVHQSCSDTEATLRIPVKLLEGYLGHFYNFSLVTNDGCFVVEEKGEEGSPSIIRVKIPFDNCGTQVERVDQILQYYNRVFISYIGTDWKLYFMNISCSTRQSLPMGALDWNRALTAPAGSLCLNGGTVIKNSDAAATCQCSEKFSGPYCGEYNLPESGVYAVTARGVFSFDTLMQITRQKRSNGGPSQRSPLFTNLIFEIHEFGGMRALRLLTGCPQFPLCRGWLAWDQYNQVVIANAKYGAYLLQMYPHAGGYIISFDMGRRFVSSNLRYFFLAGFHQNNVVFQLEKLHGIDGLQNPPPYRLQLRRFELGLHGEGGQQPMLALSLNRDSCSSSTSEFTVCVWFRSFRGPRFSPVLPLVFHNIAKLDLIGRLNGTDAMKNLKRNEVFRLQPVLITNGTMKIDIIGRGNSVIASTDKFQIPPVGYRHHLCFQGDKITLDGMPFPLRFVSSTKRIMQQDASFVASGKYLGEIDGMDAWCGKKADEFLFRESGTLPECGSRRGDLASAQSGDCILSSSAKETIVLTPETACQFCPSGWVLHHGSCYHMDLNAKSAPPSEVHTDRDGASCKPTKSVGKMVPWPAVTQLPNAPHFVGKYVDVVLGNREETVWFGLYRDKEGFWRWNVNPESYMTLTHWGPSEPRALDGVPVCAMYKSFQPNNESIPMPVASDVVSQSPNGYHWAAGLCSNKMAFICQQPSTIFDTGRYTLLRVFLFGGSYVSRNSTRGDLVDMRETLASIVDAIALETSGQIVYELLRIRSTPNLYYRSEDVVTVKTRIFGWRPFPGEPNLGKVVEYINLHSKDDRYRYINIVTSAYAQQVGPDETDSKSTTFALGITWTRVSPLQSLEDNLRDIATHPSCVALAAANRQIAARVLDCVQGFYPEVEAGVLEKTVFPDVIDHGVAQKAVFGPEAESLTTNVKATLAASQIDSTFPVLIKDTELVEPTASTNFMACREVFCRNGGTCLPTSGDGYSCKCPPGYAGVLCEFEGPSVSCEDSGVRVEVPVETVRSLSGTPEFETPANIKVYFADYATRPACVTKYVTMGTKNRDVYSLYVPAPFSNCGLVSTHQRQTDLVEVSGTVLFERITHVAIVDTTIIISNFTCLYKTKYGVGLRPYETLSAEFKPVPNRLFSGQVHKSGTFIVLVRFYLDEKCNIPLPPNPQVKIGTFLYVSLFSKYPLPSAMSLNVNSCYLTPYQDPRIKVATFDIVRNNCAVPGDLPKDVTSVVKDRVDFYFQVFQWRDGKATMYLHCTTSVCDATTSKCARNCSSVHYRRKRQLKPGDGHDPREKIAHIVPIYPIDDAEMLDRDEPATEKLGAGRKYLLKPLWNQSYLLGGLILFTFLFFSIIIVIILFRFRLPRPEKYFLHTRCSYRRGRRLSDSPPRTWTVVRALSADGPNNEAESHRRRHYAVGAEHSRVDELLSQTTSRNHRFASFLGEQSRLATSAPEVRNEAHTNSTSAKIVHSAT